MERKLAAIVVAVLFFGGQLYMAYNAEPYRVAPKTKSPVPCEGCPMWANEHKEVGPPPFPWPPASHIKKEI